MKWKNTIYNILKENPNATEDEIVDILTRDYAEFLVDKRRESAVSLVRRTITRYCSDVRELSATVYITNAEVDFLNNIENKTHRIIAFALMTTAKIHPHASGWIAYSDFIMEYILGRKLKDGEFAGLTQYGFEMRVYGKNKPMVTFNDPCEFITPADAFGAETFGEYTLNDARRFIDAVSD